MDCWYRRLFPGESKDGYPRFYEAIADRLAVGQVSKPAGARTGLETYPTSRILDVGCGDNTRLACFRGGHREVWGVDRYEHPHLAHREWFRRLAGDGSLPFADDSFDVVASCWVLEHVERPQEFLAELARVLRPGGAFVSLTVNARHYMTWLARLLQRLPHRVTQWLVARLYGRPEHDTFPTFYRLNTLAGLRHYGGQAGLTLDQVRQVANPDYFRFSRLAWSAAVLADWLLDKVSPGLGRIYWIISMTRAAPAAPVARQAA